MPDSNYDAWAPLPVSALATWKVSALTAAECERHTIFSLALMAITRRYWNGAKYGLDKRYPLNAPPAPGDRAQGDYLGHNIAALAVDGDGDVIDFEFNHNDLFASSVEHAESRLLRRLFSLTGIADGWATGGSAIKDPGYATLLKDVTVYTTLESCAQCSGIMALAQLKQVVYLQTDPGQYHIGAMMRNMTVGTSLTAPEPIPGAAFGFGLFARLDEAYAAFRARPKDDAHAMVLNADGSRHESAATNSITSFLCTGAARSIYDEAVSALESFAPSSENVGALNRARHFVDYAVTRGHRGTPHRA
jgi:tRNA(Arg) A34 adenosine deaminase TadA